MLADTLRYLKTRYFPILKSALERKWSSKAKEHPRKIIDEWGLITGEIPDYSDAACDEYKITKDRILDSPYFARIQKGSDDFYIGKIGTDTIVDWQSPRCEVYYQYQMYIGIAKENLQLVRDYVITEGTLIGYIDKYNPAAAANGRQQGDDYLTKLIWQNRNNKNTHDIIASIQHNQYEIMTQGKDQNLIVLGCAGSGKTMIMLHRISYLLYNNPSLNADRIYVI